MSRGLLSAAAAATVAAVAACGSPSADLFELERTGKGRGAKLTLLVSDGGMVTCNGKQPVALDAERLLAARELARDLETQAALGLQLKAGAKEKTTFSYEARLEEGTIAWSDSSRGIPPAYTRLAGFARGVAKGVCKLRR